MAKTAQPHEKAESVPLLAEVKGNDWWLNKLYWLLTADKSPNMEQNAQSVTPPA